MIGSLPKVWRGHVPSAFFGMLGVVLVIELGLGRHELDFKHCFTHDWVVTARSAEQRAPGCDVLCFGDSLVKFGVSPRLLEDRLGLRVYNLAVCGGQAPSSYFLLRRALDSGARPHTIVVDFIPHLLAHGPRQNERQWPELVGLHEFVDLVQATRNAAFAAALATARLVPSVKCRSEIREAVLAIVEGKRAASRETLLEYQRIWDMNQGALIRPVASASNRKYNLARWEDFTRAWSCHPVNAAYLSRFMALAQSRGIQVLWLLPPVTPDAQVRRERLGIDERYVNFVRQMQLKFANLTVIDGRHAGYESSLFLDPLHLDKNGADALSANLAEVIADSPSRAGARHWLELRDPHEVVSEFPIHAAASSTVVLQERAMEGP